MVAKPPRGSRDLADLAPQILPPLRKMRDVSPPKLAALMGMSTRAYQDFEKGRTGLRLDRLLLFADILQLDHQAIMTAFQLRRPRIALAFAHNKALLIQASAIDECDDEALDAIAAVDPLSVLDSHIGLYGQLAERGRAQLRAAAGRRLPD